VKRIGNGGDLTIPLCVSAVAECDKRRKWNIGTAEERTWQATSDTENQQRIIIVFLFSP
jgi:hypothetical protein